MQIEEIKFEGFLQCSGKYVSKEENTEGIGRIKEKRRLITGNLSSHEK